MHLTDIPSPLTSVGLLTVLILLWTWVHRRARSVVPLPPGPWPLPIIGNVRDLTPKQLWLRVTEWANIYGDVCHVHAFGQSMIFLSSPQAISALLDARGSLNSDRPKSVMGGELCRCHHLVSFSDYNDTFKRRRRLMQRALGARIIPSYHTWIQASTSLFIKDLLRSPEQYITITRKYAAGLTSSVIYGYELKSADDRLLIQSEDCLNILSNEIAAEGGVWMVDMFPVLKYLPSWLPGAGFKRRAEVLKKRLFTLAEEPFKFVKMKLRQQVNQPPSFCSVLLNDPEGEQTAEEEDVKWTATTVFLSSSDTTVATVSMFLLAILLHPDVLRKAQREIDEVIGKNRVPSFDDRSRLPYVEAVMSEALRWGAPVPLNIPHRAREEDVFRGMRIPKGSLIIANIWAILRDEKLYPNASTFDPERFMAHNSTEKGNEKIVDPRSYVFGFGRRSCPGADLAEASIWLLLVTIIATLDISAALDPSNGQPVCPDVEFKNSFFRNATDLKFNVQARYPQILSVLSSL